MNLNSLMEEYTEDLNQKGLLRKRVVSDSQNLNLIRFDSNDYLSLSLFPQISNAYQKGFELYPCGSGGSMVLNGYHPNHQAFEQAMAEWLEVDECVLYSSGYAANLAVTALLGRLNLHCLIDKGVHASIYDGLKLAEVPYTRYFHNRIEEAADKLKQGSQVLITEGIFSMSGQISPLDDLATLCKQQQAALIVDESHSFGILGGGKGAIKDHGLTQEQVPLRIISLGKVFSGQGGIVAGNKTWITALLQAGRSLIYSTAASPAMSFGLLKTLEMIIAADDRRLKLMQLIDYFRSGIKQSSLKWADSMTPIQQAQLGCPHLALAYVKELKSRGISCSAIRQPTVTKEATGLRVILNYNHQFEHIDSLLNTLNDIYDTTSH